MSDSETIKKEVDVILPRLTKKQETTIETKFRLMKFQIPFYGKDNNDDRFTDRLFYSGVGNTPTQFISIEALKEKDPKKLTNDHFMIPQFLGKMVMDLSDIYLTGEAAYEKFRELSILASRTIRVTKDENNVLAEQFRGKGQYNNLGDGYTFLPCSMSDKYELANIRLFDKDEDMQVDMYSDKFFPLYIPEEVLKYEQRFIKFVKSINNKSEVVIKNA